MISVRIAHAFPGFRLDAAFEAPGGTTVLFGPSGSGKSTVIAAIAGLLRPAQGRIAIGDRTLCDTAAGMSLKPEHRRIGMVFQDARLFPHLSVRSNLLYGLRRADPGPLRLDDVVALLGLGLLLARRPHALSGGERQRVAIGRALLSQPRLLLMDEPLASLDEARKAEILPYLARLRTSLDIPIVYVTHAMDEVVRLADTLVLLDHGRTVYAGPLAEAASRADLPLALRDDAGAVLALRVAGHDPERRLSRLEGDGMALLVPLTARAVGSAVRVRVPARELILAIAAPVGISVQNVLAGTVRTLGEDAPRQAALVEIAVGAAVLLARVTPDAVARLALVPGKPVFALVKSVAVEVL